MNTIKFNDTEFGLESYNRSTYFNAEGTRSEGSCSVIVDDMSALEALTQTTITSIQIIHNNNVIYNLHDTSAKISVINEFFTGEKININISFNFSNT